MHGKDVKTLYGKDVGSNSINYGSQVVGYYLIVSHHSMTSSSVSAPNSITISVVSFILNIQPGIILFFIMAVIAVGEGLDGTIC